MNKRYKDLQVTEGTYVPPVVTDFPEDDPYQGIYKPIYDSRNMAIVRGGTE